MGYTEEEVEDCWVIKESRRLLRARSASVGPGLNDDGGEVIRGGCLPLPLVCTKTELRWVTICNREVNVPWEGKQLSRAAAPLLVGFAKDGREQSPLAMPHGRLQEDRVSQRRYNSYLRLVHCVCQNPKRSRHRIEDLLLTCQIGLRRG